MQKNYFLIDLKLVVYNLIFVTFCHLFLVMNCANFQTFSIKTKHVVEIVVF